MHNNLIMRIQNKIIFMIVRQVFSCTCFPYIPGVELDSSQYVTTFNENGIRTQTKLNSTDAVATVSPFRTSRASNRTSSLTGQVCDAETQRLRRELQQEQERVQRLSAQLSTNVRSLILLIRFCVTTFICFVLQELCQFSLASFYTDAS